MADSFLNRAAARLEAIVRAARGPNTSTVADIPGSAHYRSPSADERTKKALESFGAYSSRVSPNAGPNRTRWALWPADGLTPETIIGAQRDAVTSGIPLRWVELIDQIFARDGHYASCTTQRMADVVKGTWRLTPSIDDDAGLAACSFVDEAYRSCSRWSDGLGWLLLSNLYAYNAVEVEWYETEITFAGPKGETVGPVQVALPKQLHNVHPKHFRFEIESDDPLFWLGNTYQPLPFGKFVFLDGEGLHPIKLRRGHAWQCVWYSLFRSLAWSAWGVHVERFSLPVPLIQYDADVEQYALYRDAYQDILNSLGQGKGAIIPKTGATFEIKDPPQGGRSNDPASALSDACDAAQSIRVLGGQLNNKIGNVGSFAASSNHLDIKYGLEELDAARMWERIDEQLSSAVLQFNAEAIAKALNDKGYNVTPAQIARRVPKGKHHIPGKTDPMVEMNILDAAVNRLGLPISLSSAFARMDFQRARDDKDRIKGEAQVVSKGGALIPNSEATQEGGIVNPDTAAEKTADAKVEEAKQADEAPKAEPAVEEKDDASKLEMASRTLVEFERAGVEVDPEEVLKLHGVEIKAKKLEREIPEVENEPVIDPADGIEKASRALVEFERAGVEVDPEEVLKKHGVDIHAKRVDRKGE
jgi:phage gp29-like protein